MRSIGMGRTRGVEEGGFLFYIGMIFIAVRVFSFN